MIVVLCGIPGSGKTTLATRLASRLAARGHRIELRHSDDFERRTYDRMYERVADESSETAGTERHWLLDGTFFRREWRNRFYRLDDTREVWVRASLETCLARNRGREDPIPVAGLRDVARRFEPPRADLEVDTEELDVAAAVDELEAAVRTWLAD